MILATPFHPALTDYEDYEKQIRRKGKLLTHVHVVISRKEDEQAAFGFSEKMSDLFLKTRTVVLPEDTRNGNQLATDLFRAAARFVHEYKHGEGELSDQALLFMDPTYRPTEPGWMDLIQSDFYLKRAPLVLGRFGREEPKLLTGPIVLNKAFYKASGLLKYVPANIHYRAYLQHEFREHAVESKRLTFGPDSVLRQQRQTKKP